MVTPLVGDFYSVPEFAVRKILWRRAIYTEESDAAEPSTIFWQSHTAASKSWYLKTNYVNGFDRYSRKLNKFLWLAMWKLDQPSITS